ncbi:hypothetical protein A3C18_02055 [Candidatus Kaiserbacteria bacterium RIFCSPHIGHO2_02_FULL_54_11b]|uniref:Plasmid stabilization protein n=2 Tax=Candidatus Kaiseribacteriota TaxID=1752734 RepID=A0A1F6CS95_9BACT|nr:MAG: hypothetical protein A2704_00315 [Candidatus Kaiserbacteria bacterium RIFCSPHIGHO2_01_FULL_54_36b]OGG63911.1 MAG: hypothetical protein A3C18_02055 [Candidatus Kaiserbacteria bacterium RIFCSPHIGHO2_02_FULL_54_11b]
MKVRYTKVALAELRDIFTYIVRDNPVAARAVIQQIEYVVERVTEFPGIGRTTDEGEVRIFPTPPFPYLVFYTVEREEVIIRNIRHAGRMRP